jgi:IS6 family transposase
MSPFKGRHFQHEIILWAVLWYNKYGISYRELQEMLAERGVNVDHSTIYRWVQSVMRLKWKNDCAGTGVTLPIYARGTLMKRT